MIKFIKKLFGFGEAPKEECPYKVEAKPVEDLADIALAQRPAPVVESTTPVVESTTPAKKPAKKAPAKKTGAPKKPRGPRKPKAPKA